MVKTALELARDAVDVLNERGWKRGPAYKSNNGPLCLGEAIGTAAMAAKNQNNIESEKQTIEMQKLRLVIQGVIPVPDNSDSGSWGPIIAWNDQAGRTKQDVMEVLDKAIDVLIPPVS